MSGFTHCFDRGCAGCDECINDNDDEMVVSGYAYHRPMPQSSKEKQEAFRARQAMLGNTEVRGIYAPPALHAVIKEFAQKLVAAEAASRPGDRK